jgi:hypothetical protein
MSERSDDDPAARTDKRYGTQSNDITPRLVNEPPADAVATPDPPDPGEEVVTAELAAGHTNETVRYSYGDRFA